MKYEKMNFCTDILVQSVKGTSINSFAIGKSSENMLAEANF